MHQMHFCDFPSIASNKTSLQLIDSETEVLWRERGAVLVEMVFEDVDMVKTQQLNSGSSE